MNNAAVNAMPKTAIKKVKHSYDSTFKELLWKERMLHYIANGLEKDYFQFAKSHTYLSTGKEALDMLHSFFMWVKSVGSLYGLPEAIQLMEKRYYECSQPSQHEFNQSTAIMLRFTVSNAFPGQLFADIGAYKKYGLTLQLKDGNNVEVPFDAKDKDMAIDMVLQAYLNQGENLPANKAWRPVGLVELQPGLSNNIDLGKEFFDRAGDLIGPPWAVDPNPQPKVKKPRAKKAKRAHPLVVSQDEFAKGLQARVDSLHAQDDLSDEGEEIIDIMNFLKEAFKDDPDMLLDVAAEMENPT